MESKDVLRLGRLAFLGLALSVGCRGEDAEDKERVSVLDSTPLTETTDPTNGGSNDPTNGGSNDPTNGGSNDPTNGGSNDPTNGGSNDPTNNGNGGVGDTSDTGVISSNGGTTTNGGGNTTSTNGGGTDTTTNNGTALAGQACVFAIPPDAVVYDADSVVQDDDVVGWVCRNDIVTASGDRGTWFLDANSDLFVTTGSHVIYDRGGDMVLNSSGNVVYTTNPSGINDAAGANTIVECASVDFDESSAPVGGC